MTSIILTAAMHARILAEHPEILEGAEVIISKPMEPPAPKPADFHVNIWPKQPLHHLRPFKKGRYR